MLVLNVDDNEGVRYARTRLIRHAGFEVIEAANGSETISLIRSCRPSIVILDVHLPDIIGLEVSRRLKADPETSTIQIIQISATAIAESVQAEALIAGADYYLSDPVSADVLVATIRAAARNSEVLQALRTVQERLEQRTVDLERSNEDLERFAYTISHDLRESLRMVSTYTELLVRKSDGQLDEQSLQFASFVQTGVRRMGSLIQGLLEYSRLADAEPTVTPVSAQTVLDTVRDSLALTIEESGARITNDPLPIVSFNEGRFTQVLQNLLANAIKYRSQEPPKIHVSARKERNEWVFSVMDNGIGFEQHKAELVFRLFSRLHSQQEYEGSGIGLPICKRLVEQNGGRMWVESTPGKGSTFYFTLPAIAPRTALANDGD